MGAGVPGYLVLLETSGNQAFVFATNKRRENVGASELLTRVARWDVSTLAGSASGAAPHLDNSCFLKMAIDTKGWLVGALAEGGDIEILVAAAGRIVALVRAEPEALVRLVTAAVLEHAPGLELCGVFSEFSDRAAIDFDAEVGRLEDMREALRARLPAADARFQRYPIVRPCETSGLPASEIVVAGLDRHELSLPSAQRWAARDAGFERIRTLLGGRVALHHSVDAADKAMDGLSWVAVVHADGNGLGQIFRQFGRWSRAAGLNDYATASRAFSAGLDRCAIAALRTGLESVQARRREQERSRPLPIVPLVLGGDDLTFVCDGSFALRLTCDILRQFEIRTRAEPAISAIARAATDVPHLTACAGVALVSGHFPFHQAYDLAEALSRNAKQHAAELREDLPSRGISTIDFHVLDDSTAHHLSDVRQRLEIEKGVLYASPYLVSPGRPGDEPRLRRRHVDALGRAIEAINRVDADVQGRETSGATLHELRQSLFAGVLAANACLADKIARRPDLATALEPLLHDKIDSEGRTHGGPSLFWSEYRMSRTAFLDAMQAARFWR